MTGTPTLAHLLDACHLLDVGLLWDPGHFPDGPTEQQRPLIMASLTVATDLLRAGVVRPDVMGAMRQIHGDAFGNDVNQILAHAVTVLSYHQEMLRGIKASEPVEDAVGLITAAVSILVSILEDRPYRRVRLATMHQEGLCSGCGGEH